MTQLYHRLYTGPLRGWLRRTGLTRVLRSPSTLKGVLRRRRFEAERPQTVALELAGVRVEIETASLAEYQRALTLRDDRHLIEALAGTIRRGDVVWDVGANIGLYSVVLSKLVGSSGQVVAFEPEPRARERLAGNLARNRALNVHVAPIALGECAGNATLHAAENGVDGTHSLVNPDGAAGSIEIEVDTADRVNGRRGIESPGVLKIDVEGAELDVLLGAEKTTSEPSCRAILCEVHFAILAGAGRADAPERISALLRGRGFTKQTWLDASHLLAERPE